MTHADSGDKTPSLRKIHQAVRLLSHALDSTTSALYHQIQADTEKFNALDSRLNRLDETLDRILLSNHAIFERLSDLEDSSKRDKP